MWALCDLAMGLLISKSTTYELKEFPIEPSISPMFFVPHEDPNFFNVETYLPSELVVQPPKKLGITIQYLQPSAAAKKNKKVSNIAKKFLVEFIGHWKAISKTFIRAS